MYKAYKAVNNTENNQICGIRPHYNDGRRSFPTCGNTCGRKLKEMTGVQAASFSFGGETQSENRPPCIVRHKIASRR